MSVAWYNTLLESLLHGDSSACRFSSIFSSIVDLRFALFIDVERLETMLKGCRYVPNYPRYEL